MKNALRGFGVLMVLVLWAGSPLVVTAQEENATTRKVYVYKVSADKERRMEIFFPPDHDPATSKAPGMILFHGGAWRKGTLGAFRVACAYFASRGIVAATAEYRMLNDAEREALPNDQSPKSVCVIDAKSAVRWFAHQADVLGIDPTRLIVGGGSAGAHISAISTMNPGLADPTDPSTNDPQVAAYVWFNPAFSTNDARFPEIDILTHLNADLPPTIVFFGDQDAYWLPGWHAAQAKWKALGVTTIDYWIAPGQKHAFFNLPIWRLITLRAVDEFLVKHGFLTGESTLPDPVDGSVLVAAP